MHHSARHHIERCGNPRDKNVLAESYAAQQHGYTRVESPRSGEFFDSFAVRKPSLLTRESGGDRLEVIEMGRNTREREREKQTNTTTRTVINIIYTLWYTRNGINVKEKKRKKKKPKKKPRLVSVGKRNTTAAARGRRGDRTKNIRREKKKIVERIKTSFFSFPAIRIQIRIVASAHRGLYTRVHNIHV